MGYASGNINSATPATALQTQIETLLTAHSTWQFVETWTSTTQNWNIWRCRGSGVAAPNSFGSDFYIALYTTTASGNTFRLYAFEAWDATNKLAIRPIGRGNEATNADGSAFATAGVSLTTSTLGYLAPSLDVASNSNDYYIQVSKNALKVGTRRSSASTTAYCMYAGLFQPFLPGSETSEFPLALVGNANTNGVYNGSVTGISTRHPKRLSQAAVTGHFQLNFTDWTERGGDTTNVDMFYAKTQGSRIVVVMNQGSSAPQTFGRLRGLLYDTAIVVGGSGVTLNLGDTITIDGTTHTHFPLGTLSGTWVNQAAA